ncbi:1-phosphofructokinase family hexose kinase [Mycobacterium sp.]|uniref:1-phosphofructokinase family hexose kinase n=1 Tax=Mycobacterium sp. TaxID=1785 RepID=UPI002CFC024E|nr:1-phosphofructokinase family hexose kinase [Mycobacterium sp.]HME47344.1 1-phosphofructokinase family hexose kinase [Mycobacterium sp.]
MRAEPTIVTLTMNPALDVTTDTERVLPTDKLRCGPARYDPGGGGINVARTVRVLGAPVCAIFPAGGAAGDIVTDLVSSAGIPIRRIDIAGDTRESLTVNERSTGRQYRFVLPGPTLDPDEQAACLAELAAAAVSADYVVASGSLPPGVPGNFYESVAEICRATGTRLVLDTSGAGLQNISSRVHLLKPSVRELRECVGRVLADEADQLAAARELIETGRAEIVVVSLGARGALLVTTDTGLRYAPVDVPFGSGVGAGDAMVAAITVGLSRGWSLDGAVRLGIAAGGAMLLTPGTAPCTRPDVERLFELVDDPVEVATATNVP